MATPDGPKTRRVLLCGEFMDGQWVDVRADTYTFRAAKPQTLDLNQWIESSDVLDVPMPEVVEYRLEPLPIRIRTAGGELWVGVAGYGPQADEAIMRAILQRDVALQILGRR